MSKLKALWARLSAKWKPKPEPPYCPHCLQLTQELRVAVSTLRQIVERTEYGSPNYETATRALAWMHGDREAAKMLWSAWTVMTPDQREKAKKKLREQRVELMASVRGPRSSAVGLN